MKLSIVFIVAIVAALVAPSHQTYSPLQPPLNSIIRNALVDVLEFVNKVLNSVENYANNYFLEKLQNATQIKEWSVNIQNVVTTGVTELFFDVFNAYRLFVEASIPITDVETRVMDCISNQESNILTAVKNATTLNGWCNNRLAANLTAAFQETTAALLSVNVEFESYAESLKACSLGDTICLAEYAAKVAKAISREFAGNSGTISAGLKDVLAVYKIMFGQDVPACYKEYFAPTMLDGFLLFVREVTDCAV